MQKSKFTKLLCVVLSLMMILCAAPLTVFAEDHVHVDADKNNVCDGCSKELYIVRSWDATKKKVVDTLTAIPADAVALESSETAVTLEAGTTYVVAGSVTCALAITVSGTPDAPTNLIVKDGASLTAAAGIINANGKELRIFGQAKDSGIVKATSTSRYSAIGNYYTKKAGNVTIHGGNITAVATGSNGSGIGACGQFATGATVIYGGTVTATGIGVSPGINTTVPGSCTIYGGVVVATSSKEGAGIGTCGHSTAEAGPITIYGGNVTAQSLVTDRIQSSAAGIGGGAFNDGAAFTMYGGTVTALGSEDVIGGEADGYSAGIGAVILKYDTPGNFDTYQGTITIDGEPVIKSGYSAEDAKATTVEDYIANRDRYVYIHLHDFSGEAKSIGGKHAYKCTGCDLYGNEEEHTFENHACTVCGMADKITNGELLALVGDQKFVSSTGIVFRAAENEIGNYNLYFDKSALTMVTASAKDVEVTSYGYKLTSSIYDGAGGYIDNYYEFYFDGTGFTKLVCSNLVKAVRNDTYLPYHPVTQVSVKDATCTENGVNTAYWICTDEGCGKAFTDNTCATEIPAETLATYIIPATGHDFTGDYVPGTGDNAGKHARKCVNTDCTAVGLETTVNAYEACTGMEDDFTCDLCGYYDEAAAAAAALAEAKAEAAVAVELLGTGDDSDEVAAIIEKALADIEAATTVDAVEAIAAAAETDVAAQRAAEEVAAALAAAKAEAKATVNALAEGASDAVKAIVAKAVENIEAAANESAVNSIVSDAKNKVNAQKNLENVIASKKAEVSTALANARTDEAKEILTKALADLDNCTDLSNAYSIPAIAIGSANGKDSMFNGYLNSFKNVFINSLSDNAIAAEEGYLDYIIPALESCTNIDDLLALYDAEEKMIDFYDGRDGADTRYDKILKADDISDETKALAAEAAEKIRAASTLEELKDLCKEYDAKVSLSAKKDGAVYTISNLATADDSDEVTAIIEKAIADIKAASSEDAVKAVRNAAVEDIEAQRETEAEALAEAKAEAAAAVELLGTDDDSDEVAAIIEKALADIENAKNIAAVEAIAETAAEDVADQRAAEALAAAKEDAKAAVEALAADDDSDEVTAIIEKALADIEDAADIDAVEAIADAAEKDVAEQKAAEAAAALAAAKADAKTAVEALADDTASDEVKAIIEKALADIETAEDIAAVEAIADAAETDVADQIAAEKAAAEAAKALAEAKEAAKAAIDAAIEEDDSDDVKAAAEEAKAAIDAATTIEEVEAAKTSALEKMEDARGRCPYCGVKEHKNWVDTLFCLIKRLVKLITMVFDFADIIKAE